MTGVSQGARSAPPFLKWAGGKRWLTPKIAAVPSFPGRYIEPFLGSGAMFFRLRPASALLSDVNAALIEVYQAIQADHERVLRYLRTHAIKHCEEYYYSMRETSCRNAFSRAARFIYLNRTCWNGLYRVNRRGVFNVPIGTKTKVILDDDDFADTALALQGCEIITADFENQIDRAIEGDFVFADPPYTVRHKHNGFIKYNENLFKWEDQVRLRDALLRARSRGVRILLTNADHESIRALYNTDFELAEYSRYSAISGASRSRGKYPELLIA